MHALKGRDLTQHWVHLIVFLTLSVWNGSCIAWRMDPIANSRTFSEGKSFCLILMLFTYRQQNAGLRNAPMQTTKSMHLEFS